MNKKTFDIKYEVKFNDGSGLLGKEIRIKNCMSELHAQIRLEDYLKKKYSNFERLVVNECKEDVISMFGDMFGTDFSSMFGGYKR